MPEVSRFLGMVVAMFFNDHAPPHFHVRYGELAAVVGIDPPVLLAGRLPPRVMGLVVEWAILRRTELATNWERARRLEPLEPVAPLE